jgi:hypothetical protein
MLDVISTNARRGHLLKTGDLLKTGATWGRDGSLIMDFSQECFYLATLEDASWLNNIRIPFGGGLRGYARSKPYQWPLGEPYRRTH